MAKILPEERQTSTLFHRNLPEENFGRYLAIEQTLIDGALKAFLGYDDRTSSVMHRAMQYSLFAGGKRFRPILTLAAGRALDAPEDHLMPAACAVELIHTYSLIHDDLPSMDNDDLRRGQPTSHRVFGEAIALLTGDALLTKAFQILAEHPSEKGMDSRRLQVIQTLARAGGAEGMIAGQAADIEWTGQDEISEETVRFIHERKTAALIKAAVVAGGLMAGASEESMRILDIYGGNLGLAFQIVDDVLDTEQNSSGRLGKTAGKDAAQKKATYASVLGLEESRRRAQTLIKDALSVLHPWAEKAIRLRQLAEFSLRRMS